MGLNKSKKTKLHESLITLPSTNTSVVLLFFHQSVSCLHWMLSENVDNGVTSRGRLDCFARDMHSSEVKFVVHFTSNQQDVSVRPTILSSLKYMRSDPLFGTKIEDQ